MNRIKQMRVSKRMKQEELAKILNVSQASLSGYETGKYEASLETYKFLADYFGVSLDYLLGNTDDPAENKKAAPENGDSRSDLEDMLLRYFRQVSPDRQLDLVFEARRQAKEQQDEEGVPPKAGK